MLIDDSPEEFIQWNSDSVDSTPIADTNDAQISRTPTSGELSDSATVSEVLQPIDCLPSSADVQNKNTSLTSEPVVSTLESNATSEDKITTLNSQSVLPSTDTNVVDSNTKLHESAITKQASVDLPSQASLTKIGQLKNASFNESIAESEEGDLDDSDNVKMNEDLLRQQSLDSVSTGYPSPVFIEDTDDMDGKAPDFKMRLFTQWALLDGDMVMSVKVDSESDVDVVWFKDNSKIEEQGKHGR